MLTAHHLTKSFNLQTLFENVTFSVNPGDRVGLIGPNGSGKTTLMRLLAGVEAPTAGAVAMPAGLRLGYLPQGAEFEPDLTLAQTIDRAAGRAAALEDDLAAVAAALALRPDDEGLHLQYDHLLRRMASADAAGTAAVLAELGLADLDPDLPAAALSGGQKTRLSLALTLLEDPALLLLDEPTNHLDIAMLEWLESWLAGFDGGALIISHDRTFLDRVTNKTLYLDPEQKAVREYTGSYSDYLDQSLAEQEKQWAAYKDQVADIRRMRQDIARTREQSMSVERSTTPRQPGVRRIAKKVMKKALSREKKLERYLDSDDRVEKPKAGWQMKVDWSGSRHLGRSVLDLDDLLVGYDRPLLNTGQLHVQAGQRIIMTGENGSGKTTLLRTLAGMIPSLGGRFRLGASVRLGYMTQEQELIDPELSPVAHLERIGFGGETEIRSYLHFYLFKDDEPLKPASLLSFGQRARLALALMVAEGCNLLLLDEPINHLDIPSRTQFEQALHQFDGTVIAVVHDRYFIKRMATEVWWVEDGRIRREL